MTLPRFSDEQYKVIQNLSNSNVLVDSVAGSGKTTTNLHLAKHYPDHKILLLTYNAKLKIETRQKVITYNTPNMEVQSYHSFCVKYYQRDCFTDSVIKKMLLNDTLIPLKSFNYDLIVLDESQDMTPLYYQLFCKLYTDNTSFNTKQAKICLLGDKYQSIYQFNNADARFITWAPQLFNLNTLPWEKTSLSYSFRVTHEIANFINKCLLGDERIKSKRVTFHKPKYIICDCFGSRKGGVRVATSAFNEVKRFLTEGYKPSDIFILAPSVKNATSPVRRLENEIKKRLVDIPIYVPVSDEEKLDQEVLENKMVFSTFHQAKGLERKIVIVFNFDASYFKYFNKHQNTNICPNEMYVATTRACDHLILLHHYRNDYFPFINKSLLKEYADVQYHCRIKVTKSKSDKNRPVSVTDLIRHLTQETLDKCLTYIKLKGIRKKANRIKIRSKTKQKFGHENVSEITGTAIPAYFEYKLKGTMDIFDRLGLNPNVSPPPAYNPESNTDTVNDGFLTDSDDEELSQVATKVKETPMQLDNITIDQLLYVANKWCSYKNGYIFKLDQISNYNWVSNEDLSLCVHRLYSLGISDSAQFEQKSEAENKPELFNRKLTGYFDCVDGNNLYEFKCVKALKKEHVLQLAIYKYLYLINNQKNIKMATSEQNVLTMLGIKTNDDETKRNEQITTNDSKFFIYNILSDKLMEVQGSLGDLQQMIEFLIYNKYFEQRIVDDSAFKKMCDGIKNKYLK
tara:strand:- start:989 stop:3208 length:2220 start_codon:yes stop_codon:yes gene_type:complete